MKVPKYTDTGKDAWTPDEAYRSIIDQGYTEAKAAAYRDQLQDERDAEKQATVQRRIDLGLAAEAGSRVIQQTFVDGVWMSLDEARKIRRSS